MSRHTCFCCSRSVEGGHCLSSFWCRDAKQHDRIFFTFCTWMDNVLRCIVIFLKGQDKPNLASGLRRWTELRQPVPRHTCCVYGDFVCLHCSSLQAFFDCGTVALWSRLTCTGSTEHIILLETSIPSEVTHWSVTVAQVKSMLCGQCALIALWKATQLRISRSSLCGK